MTAAICLAIAVVAMAAIASASLDTASLLDDADYTFVHLTNSQLAARLEALAGACPKVAMVASAGLSRDGSDLWVFRLTGGLDAALRNAGASSRAYDSLFVLPDKARPTVRLIGNMHGDEVLGRTLMINLIELLCLGSAQDSAIADLVDSVDFYIMPSMNPDGYQSTMFNSRALRENTNNVDLNRDFPDQFKGPTLTAATRQPEVQAVMKLMERRTFHLAANFHGGALVVNYPWDGAPTGDTPASPTDVSIFRTIARTYADRHPTMKTISGNCDQYFADGITQGYQWYPLYGGMQDYSYVWHQTYEVTVEVGCTKVVPNTHLRSYWDANRASILAYISHVQYVVQGSVSPADEEWTVRVDALGIEHEVGADGTFWLLLLPDATYDVVLTGAGGEAVATRTVSVSSGVSPSPLLFDGSDHVAATKLRMTIIVGTAFGIVVIASIALLLVRYRKSISRQFGGTQGIPRSPSMAMLVLDEEQLLEMVDNEDAPMPSSPTSTIVVQ